MHKTIVLLLCAGLALAGCGGPPDPADAPAEGAAAATGTAADPSQGERPARGERRLRERMERLRDARESAGRWWEDHELAQGLGITAEQAAAIGAQVSAHEQSLQVATTGMREALASYRSALREQDLAAARAAAEAHAEAVAAQARLRHLLPLEVLELLDPAQRSQLLRERPGLLLDLARATRQRAQEP